VKRAGFALLAALALHGAGSDEQLADCLPLIERAASDERNFIKKGVSWALRGMGRRASLIDAALQLAQSWQLRRYLPPVGSARTRCAI
jgi:3-methyladenine DNA glycosylase AlkD